MPHEERNTIFALLTSLVVNGYMIWKLAGLRAAGAFDGADALQVFGKTVIWVIPLSIAVTLVLTVLGNIVLAILTGDPKPDFTVDERDRTFRIRGLWGTIAVIGAGFILAMAGLALGWAALPVFTLLYFAFAAGDLTGNLIRLGSYRIGA